MTLKPPLLALTISAFLALPASAAKPTNDAAAFKTFDLYANRTAVGDSVHDHVNLSAFPAWLNTDALLAYEGTDIPDASIEDVSSEHDNGGDVDDPLTGYDVEIPTTVDGHYTVNVFADDGLAMSASGYTSAGIFASDDAVDTTAAPIGATYDVLYSGSGQTVTVARTGSVGVVPALPSGPGLLRVRKSPTTGPVEFVLTGAQVAGETIEVFDISGRHVDVVYVAGDGGNQIVPWRWQSVGCRPGVYLARLRSRPGETTRFVILR